MDQVDVFFQDLHSQRPATLELFHTLDPEFQSNVIWWYAAGMISIDWVTDSWLTLTYARKLGANLFPCDLGPESEEEGEDEDSSDDEDLFIEVRRPAKKPRLAKGFFKDIDYTCVCCFAEPTVANSARFYNRNCEKVHAVCHSCLITQQRMWLQKRAEAKAKNENFREIPYLCAFKCKNNYNHHEVLPIPDKLLEKERKEITAKQAEERSERYQARAVASRTDGKDCGYCARRFKSTSARTKHVNSVHLDIRYVCWGCDKQYVGRDKFEKHGTLNNCWRKSYTCKVCWKGFNDRTKRNRHIKACTSDSFRKRCPLFVSIEIKLSYLEAKRNLEKGNVVE